MDDTLKNKLDEIRKLKETEREEKLLELLKEEESAFIYNELGMLYREKNETEKSIEMFEKALTLMKDASLYNNLGSAYFVMAGEDQKRRDFFMKKTLEAFKHSADMNSASYFFLGNLYMPKVNAPFPDDYEKAVSYFMKIEKEKTYFWGLGMKNIGMYYYHVKKDYVKAAAYLNFAKEADPKDKKAANYYEYAFGKVHNRKFWKEQYTKMKDQNDVDRWVKKGYDEITLRCPRCKSTKCSHISGFKKMKVLFFSSVGTNRLDIFSKKYYCESCKHEW